MLNVIKILFSATFLLTFLYQKLPKHKKTFRNVKNVTRINNVRKLIREPSPVMDVDAVNGEQVARRVDFIPQRSGVERRELELR